MSTLRDEGVTKFHCTHHSALAFAGEKITQLVKVRNMLFEKGYIGVYPDGIGYGNLSIRNSDKTFVITATQTGHIPQINESHITLVEKCDILNNEVVCRGVFPASSESLTHYMFYQSDIKIQAVVHIHNFALWKKYMNVLPTSGSDIPYGTQKMADTVRSMYEARIFSKTPILVMGGHEDGIISFGASLPEATENLLRL